MFVLGFYRVSCVVLVDEKYLNKGADLLFMLSSIDRGHLTSQMTQYEEDQEDPRGFGM